MSALNEYRNQIDEIDSKLVKLFEERMNVVKKVVEFKIQNNLPIYNGNREIEVIEKNIAKLDNKEYEDYVRRYFQELMEISRELQNKIMFGEDIRQIDSSRIGFQGVKGSFSEEALIKFFGSSKDSKSYEEFEDVFLALQNKEVDYAILPIENSCTGPIAAVYDLLKKYDFYIVGEECIRIEQHLIGIANSKIETIEEIYSHPQGFEQSSIFLSKYDHIKLIPFHNTAISAKMICDLNDKSKAAIASKRAADIYGLEVIEESINDKKDNYTKFIIIGRGLEVSKNADKMSVVFSLEDEAGTLYGLLKYFADNNINLIKIESRPNKNASWKYMLYIDFEGNLRNDDVRNALELIKDNSKYFKILGCYERFESHN